MTLVERRNFPDKEPIDPVIRKNLEAVASHIRYEQNHDIDNALELYTDDIEWIAYIRKGGPLVVKGKEAAGANYHSIFDALEDITFETLLRSATRKYVFDRSTVKFTVAREGHFSGLSPGEKGELVLYHIFEMRDGQICKEEVYEIPPDTVYEVWKP